MQLNTKTIKTTITRTTTTTGLVSDWPYPFLETQDPMSFLYYFLVFLFDFVAYSAWLL